MWAFNHLGLWAFDYLGMWLFGLLVNRAFGHVVICHCIGAFVYLCICVLAMCMWLFGH